MNWSQILGLTPNIHLASTQHPPCIHLKSSHDECSKALPLFPRSFTSVYYCQHKPKNRIRGRHGNVATHIISSEKQTTAAAWGVVHRLHIHVAVWVTVVWSLQTLWPTHSDTLTAMKPCNDVIITENRVLWYQLKLGKPCQCFHWMLQSPSGSIQSKRRQA